MLIDTALTERLAYIKAYSTNAQQLCNKFNYVKENNKVSLKRLKVLRSNCSLRTFAATAFIKEETKSSMLSTLSMLTVQLTYSFNQKSIIESIDSIASKQSYAYSPF
jgi:ribosomal protein S8